jgi:hypothetical protein
MPHDGDEPHDAGLPSLPGGVFTGGRELEEGGSSAADGGSGTGGDDELHGGERVIYWGGGTEIEDPSPDTEDTRTDTSDIPDGPGDEFDASDHGVPFEMPGGSGGDTEPEEEDEDTGGPSSWGTIFPTEIDSSLNYFAAAETTLRGSLSTINTNSKTEWEQAVNVLTINYQPRILSMIDFVPMYSGDDNTKTAACELIDNKRIIFDTLIDNTVKQFSITEDHIKFENPQAFLSPADASSTSRYNVSIADLDSNVWPRSATATDSDALANLASDLYRWSHVRARNVYEDLENSYMTVDFSESIASGMLPHNDPLTDNLSPYTGIGPASLEHPTLAYLAQIGAIPLALNNTHEYSTCIPFESTDEIDYSGDGPVSGRSSTMSYLLSKIEDPSPVADLQSSEIIKTSFITILDYFSLPWQLFPEIGRGLFDGIKTLRGKKIEDRVNMPADWDGSPESTIDVLNSWEPYNILMNNTTHSNYEEKVSALLLMLDTKVSLLSSDRHWLQYHSPVPFDNAWDYDVIDSLKNASDAYKSKITSIDEREISEFNLFTKDGVFDSLMVLNTMELSSDKITYSDSINDYYQNFSEKALILTTNIDGLFSCGVARLIPADIDTYKQWVNPCLMRDASRCAGLFNSLQQQPVSTNYSEGDTSAGYGLPPDNDIFTNLFRLNNLHGVGPLAHLLYKTLHTNFPSEWGDVIPFEMDDTQFTIAGNILHYFCYYTLIPGAPFYETEVTPTELYFSRNYDIDQEFLFLVFAIATLLSKFTPPTYDYSHFIDEPAAHSTFHRIFNGFIDKKISMLKATTALKNTAIHSATIGAGIKETTDSKQDAGTLDVQLQKHFLSKRTISSAKKKWNDFFQQPTNQLVVKGPAVVHDRFDMSSVFKNAALEIFMKEEENKQSNSDTIERKKKILSIGLPFGLLDEFEKRDLVDACIEISVHKRHWLNDNITYKPKTFKFPLNSDTVFNDYVLCDTQVAVPKLAILSAHTFGARPDGGTWRFNNPSTYTAGRSGYTNYEDFVFDNMSELIMTPSTYSHVDNYLYTKSISNDFGPIAAAANRNLIQNAKSKLYEYYIYSLYGIDLNRRSFQSSTNTSSTADAGDLEFGDLTGTTGRNEAESLDYFNSFGADYYDFIALKNKFIFSNYKKFMDEINKKPLFDKVFHVLINTETDFELDDDGDTSDVLSEEYTNSSVKYDDFFVTIDVKGTDSSIL